MTAGDPLAGFEKLGLVARYDHLIEIVPRAYDEGVLTPLPHADAQVIEEALVASRIRTVRTRLYLLKYFDSDSEVSEVDRALRGAIRRFQREAGLRVDGWVGEETWRALEELVSFEAPANMRRWTRGPELSRVLRRAIGLRLLALGLLDERTWDKTKIRRGLKAFVAVANLIGLTVVSLDRRDNLAVLTALFDQNLITARLAALNPARIAQIEPEDATTVRRFLAHVAKIELWLAGYDVKLGQGDLDRDGDYPQPEAGVKQWWRDPKYAFFYALYSFWRDGGHHPAKARRLAEAGLSAELFRELSLMVEGEAQLTFSAAESQQLYAEIVALSTEKKTLAETIWKTIQALGARLWDGIKRAWRWFKRLIKKAEPYVRWAKNLARLAYTYAQEAFADILEPVQRVVRAAAFFLPDIAPGSQVPDFFIRRDKTFDYQVVSTPGHTSQLLALSREMHLQAQYFRIGVRMLAVLSGAVLAVLEAALLPGVGWFAFIIALVKAFAKLQALLAETRALAPI